MSPEKIQFGWFDLVTIGVIIGGLLMGRKRGMSAELLDVFQWLLIVVLAGNFYEPVGRFIARQTMTSHLFGYIFGYLLVAVAIKIVFMTVKQMVGGKLVGSDIFGRGEYYLGMVAGIIHLFCILLLVLAITHARLYPKGHVQKQIAAQKESLGSEFFPSFASIQQDIFEKSFTGPFITNYLENMLIKKTAPDTRSVRERGGPAQRKEQMIEDLTAPGGKK